MGKKNDNRVVLQSFVRHRVTVNFRDEKGNVVMVGPNAKTVTVPSWMEAPKNILVMAKDDFEAVSADLKPYLDLGQNKGIVPIEDIPSGYWDPTEQVAAERAARTAAEGERDGAIKRAETAEAEIVRLKSILVDKFGWKDDSK